MRKLRILAKNYSRELILFAVIIAIGIIVTPFNRAFFTSGNILNILNSYAITGIMAIGMMLVIITGNIDVSAGAQFAVTGMVAGSLAKLWNGQNLILILLITVTIGFLLGAINGFFVAKLNIPAIIVTLATLGIMRGSLILITDGVWVEQISGPIAQFAKIKVGPFSMLIISWIFVVVIAYVLIYKTKVGRSILAVGGNANGAKRIGISTFKTYMMAFASMGALSGVAAVLNVSRLAMAHPTAGAGVEMKLIASVVIGGTMFQGGTASISGTVLGVILFGVIENALVLLKVPVYWQNLVTGLVLLMAITSSAKHIFGNIKSKFKRRQVSVVAEG